MAGLLFGMLMIAGCQNQSPKNSVSGVQSSQVVMEGELPAQESIAEVFDELDLQQATQTYLWALPLVSYAQWQYEHENVFGAKSGDIVFYKSYEDKLGILTANATTPYLIAFINLADTGPIVVEMPAGHVAGGMGDFWQREIGVLGEMGADKGKGGKYILLPPGNTEKFDKAYTPIQSTTMNVFFGLRTLDADEAKSMETIKNIKIYPYSQRSNPPATRLVSPDGKKWYGGQPSGIDYWKRLHAIIQQEPVAERDRFFMSMLHNLGIDKGQPFNPTEHQIKILTEAAEKGELMAKANSFSKRFKDVKHWPDRKWDYVMVIENARQAVDNYELLDQRTSYFYEAVTYSEAMITKTPNVGQAYLGSYVDSNGQWLDGGKNYTLNVPANPPAVNFWSITVYDIATRCLIDNEQKNADLSSRKDLIKNADGSVDLYFGPTAPAGKEQNWVQTVPGKHWFAYYRFYGPTEQYFDKSWKSGDITEIK